MIGDTGQSGNHKLYASVSFRMSRHLPSPTNRPTSNKRLNSCNTISDGLVPMKYERRMGQRQGSLVGYLLMGLHFGMLYPKYVNNSSSCKLMN
jgi:hypothetical protein